MLRTLFSPLPSVHIGKQTNDIWNDTRRGTSITVKRKTLFAKSSRIYTIGSCFAREIRKALTKRGLIILPNYRALAFDPATQRPAGLPKRLHLNVYNSFVIRDELTGRMTPHTFIRYDSGAGRYFPTDGPLWQDPFRRGVCATSEEALADISQKIDLCITDAVASADLFVITLGLTEVFRETKSGRVVNQIPNNDPANFIFERSTIEQNLENMRAVCRAITKPILLTVSPVPLNKTFSGLDVVVANSESKSILRAVAGQIEREFPHVTYWPSYEIARAKDLFGPDARNVTPRGIDLIVNAFIDAHFDGESP